MNGTGARPRIPARSSAAERTRKGRIYLNAQTWAVIAGVADEERAGQVMDAVERYLEHKAGPLLLAPAYTTPDAHIGYLSRYAPGVRENGGVYTHAATWSVLAAARIGRGEMAYRLFSKINPIDPRHGNPTSMWPNRTSHRGISMGPIHHIYGRGGWTWYTGSAAWLFRVAIEGILGVRPTADGLIVDPCITPCLERVLGPTDIQGGARSYYGPESSGRVSFGVVEVEIDGDPASATIRGRGALLPSFAPGSEHRHLITMGKST